MDREKVIKAIDICLGNGKCDDCGYRIKGGYSTMDCRKPMMRDALALLQEQEAKNVVNMTLSKDCFLIASCPKCNALLTRVEHKNYCGYCGQAVKWE